MEYTLKAVSAYLGVPPDTLRKWEARHAVARPRRRPNGYRAYSEADLEALRRFAEGRRSGLDGPRAARAAVSARPEVLPPARRPALDAALRFDRPALKRLYEERTRRNGFLRAWTGLWWPLLAELGERAHAERGIWIAAEHFATAFLRESVLASFPAPPRRGPRLVLAGPEGERHELGMLAAACALQGRGVSCVYLGADLPLDSLEAALPRLRADGLSLTLTVARPRKEVRAWLSRLRGRFPGLPLFVSGRESLRHANLVRELGARFLGVDLARGVEAVAAELGTS